ncbi:DoxX-like family protein [Bacillus salacetis]|uniref:DoxX-like family protein n=1 Tax=Bacillus salacetis TaxID=2315464 RepID=UPI003BA3A610
MDCEMEKLWEHTQNPDLHSEWDLRFTEITYLPREEGEPQRFRYKTNIGFGLSISGTGETAGEIHKRTGERVSSLKFWTKHPLSLIKEGRGYWKYTPAGKEISFETQYDYDTNFGKAGAFADSYLFRPLIGWATAWSFDLLKLWLEKGHHPQLVIKKTVTYWLISLVFFVVWLYQGLVPKLIFNHPEEISMLTALIGDGLDAVLLLKIIGLLEMAFAFVWILPFSKKRLFAVHGVILVGLTVSAVSANPESAFHPFNPLTFNLTLIGLSIAGFLNSSCLPSAKHCKRSRKER